MIFFSIKITSVFCGCGNLSHRLSYYLRDYRNYTTLSAISQSITLSEAAARAYNDDEYLREKANGFIHLINSGACCLDACGEVKDADEKAVMKPFFEMTDKEQLELLSKDGRTKIAEAAKQQLASL